MVVLARGEVFGFFFSKKECFLFLKKEKQKNFIRSFSMSRGV